MTKNPSYAVLPEPPITILTNHWDETHRRLTYCYNNRPLISIDIPGTSTIQMRTGSDGNLCTMPPTQQIFVIVDNETVWADATFLLSDEAGCMRPERAQAEEAILGRCGNPLIFGVPGLYDIREDILIDWYGAQWNWTDAVMRRTSHGNLYATIRVELGSSPWIINVRLRYYQKHLGYEHYAPWKWRPKLEPVSGWCSWEAYRRDLTESLIGDVSRFLKKYFHDYGMRYVQIDDGFQPEHIPQPYHKSLSEGWLSTTSQFPRGHAGIVESIRDQGFEAGIWVYTYAHDETFARNVPGFFKDSEGNPIKGAWIGYVIDCTIQSLKLHIIPTFRGLKNFGYTYLKTDGLRHLMYDGLQLMVSRNMITNEEAEKRFRRYVIYLRKALGEDIFYLSSWGIFTQMAGIADACRIATDANPSWPGIRMQIVESARWFHTQRILFINDPDHLCMRANLDWAKSVISLTSLSGQMLMLSDAIHEYDSERIRIIQQNLPPLKTYTAETGPLSTFLPAYTWTKEHGVAFKAARDEAVRKKAHLSVQELVRESGQYRTMSDNHPFSTLWAFHLEKAGLVWGVVMRIATRPLDSCEVDLYSLGLNPDTDYCAFDFWKQSFLGIVSQRLPCSPLELGDCQVICLRSVQPRPQFLASSRHVSMDAVSLLSQSWQGNQLELALEGILGTTENYWIYIPDNYSFEKASVDGQTVQAEIQGNTVKITVSFGKSPVALCVSTSEKVNVHGFTGSSEGAGA